MLQAAKAAEPQSGVPTPGEWMFGHYEVAGDIDAEAS
jgi:hypothetical protein